MPYKVSKSGSGYKVKNKDTGKTYSKKPMSKKKATDQMKAIYANTSESFEDKLTSILEMSSSGGVADASSVLDNQQQEQDAKQNNIQKPVKQNNLQKPKDMNGTNQFLDLLNTKLQNVDQDNPDQLADALDAGLHDVTNDVTKRATDMNQMAQKLKSIKLH